MLLASHLYKSFTNEWWQKFKGFCLITSFISSQPQRHETYKFSTREASNFLDVPQLNNPRIDNVHSEWKKSKAHLTGLVQSARLSVLAPSFHQNNTSFPDNSSTPGEHQSSFLFQISVQNPCPHVCVSPTPHSVICTSLIPNKCSSGDLKNFLPRKT